MRSLPWAAAAATGALLLVAILYVGPFLPLLLPFGLLLVAVAAFRPKAFALIAVGVIIFATIMQNVLGRGGAYADEAVVLLALVAFCARRLATEGRLLWMPGTGWFAGFLVIGLISSTMAGLPLAGVLAPAFLLLKGVLLAFALTQLRWTLADLATVVRWGLGAIALVTVTGILNLLAPLAWSQLTTGRPPISYIGPIPAINGIFQHPAAFSRFCGVLAVACLVYGLVVRRSLGNTLLTLLCGGLAFLTLQVKSIVGLLATLTAVGGRFLTPAAVAALVCVSPLVAIVGVPPLAALIGGDIEVYLLQDSARSTLTEGGVTVAAQYFPWGAGFGRYGTSTAALEYSPLYYALGFPDRYGLGPGPDSGQFLNDTQWPALYGEAGWFGAAFFALGLVCMLRSLLRRTEPAEAPLLRWARVTGVGWMILLLIESAAAPVFVSSPSFPFVFAAAGVVASLRQTARERVSEDVSGVPGGHRTASAT